jgi:hypothetical protein
MKPTYYDPIRSSNFVCPATGKTERFGWCRTRSKKGNQLSVHQLPISNICHKKSVGNLTYPTHHGLGYLLVEISYKLPTPDDICTHCAKRNNGYITPPVDVSLPFSTNSTLPSFDAKKYRQ